MIEGAAEDAPDRVAWIDDEGSMSFAQAFEALPTLDGHGPVFITPRLDRDSFLKIHAAIEAGRTLVLTHPREDEQTARLRIERLRGFALPPMLAVLQTSGTSGVRKEVLLSHRAFVAAAEASEERLGWQPDDRWGLFLPPAHVGGLSVLIRCVLGRTAVVAGDAKEVATCIERHRVTLTSLVPTMLHRLLAEGWSPPSHLRAVLLGGDAATPSLRKRALAAGVPILPTYGMTETCAQAATALPGDEVGETSCGAPLHGVEMRAVDGELQVRGDTLMDGVLVPAPDESDGPPFRFEALPPDGWLHTGDLGRVDGDGCVHVLGRIGDRIITGGENVDPASVEAALEQVEGISRCCVFGVPDERFGQLVAVAAVCTRPLDDCLREAALADHARPRLGVALDDPETLGTGKLNRGQTRDAVLADLRPVRGK